MGSAERLIEAEVEASEQNKDAALRPGTGITRGHGRTQTLQIRLNGDELAALAELADLRGIPVSTLARDLLLRQLRGQDDDPQSVIARMRFDLDALAARVA